MANEIKINIEELEELALKINDLLSNNQFLIYSIVSLKQEMEKDVIYGIEKKMYDKLDIYEAYFMNEYTDYLQGIQFKIADVAQTFYQQDIENERGLT